MCRNHQFVAIDGQKLTNMFNRLGVTKKEAAENFGYSEGYFTDVCRYGKARASVVKVLEKVYGIAYEDIRPDPEPEPIPEPVKEEVETTVKEDATATVDISLDYDDIASAVRKGVTAAINDILVTADTRATIMELIKNAHKMALRENLKERIQEQGGKMR